MLTFATFLSNLKKIISNVPTWLKVFFNDPKGGIKQASPEIISKYGKMIANGGITINNRIFLITTPKLNILIPLVFPKRTDLLHECVIY